MPCVAGINSCGDACQYVLILSVKVYFSMSETTKQSGLRLALISPFNNLFVLCLQYLIFIFIIKNETLYLVKLFWVKINGYKCFFEVNGISWINS